MLPPWRPIFKALTMSQTKKCRKCGEEKEVEQFHFDRHGVDGLTSACKPCNNAASRRWQHANRDIVRVRDAERRLARGHRPRVPSERSRSAVASPTRQEAAGHLYVIRFANDMIKAGRATDVTVRVRDHANEGARHGNAMVEHWTSPVIERIELAETVLLRWCEEQPGAIAHFGREWFTGLDYVATVEEAQRLCTSGAAARTAARRAERARLNEVVAMAERQYAAAQLALNRARAERESFDQSAVSGGGGGGNVRAKCTAPASE